MRHALPSVMSDLEENARIPLAYRIIKMELEPGKVQELRWWNEQCEAKEEAELEEDIDWAVAKVIADAGGKEAILRRWRNRAKRHRQGRRR